MLVFLLEERGRVLDQKTVSRFLSAFSEQEGVQDVTTTSGQSTDTSHLLLDQIQLANRDGVRWEVAYFYGGSYTYVLDEDEKDILVSRLCNQQPSHVICKEILQERNRI